MSIRARDSLQISPGIRRVLGRPRPGGSDEQRDPGYSIRAAGAPRATSVGAGPGDRSVGRSRRRPEHGRGREALGVGGATGASADPSRSVPSAGFLASHAEKSYRNGVLAYLRREYRSCVDAMTICLAAEHGIVSARLFAGFAADAIDEPDIAITHLEALLKSDVPLPDRFETEYLPDAVFSLGLSIQVTDVVTVHAPFTERGAAFMLAQLYRDAGRLEDAIGIMQQLDEVDPLARLTLADLLLEDADYPGVVELSTGVANDSDLDVELLRQRAGAFLALGLPTAAQEAFRDALARTAGRDAGLLLSVRYDRALAYEQAGQAARARADFERIYAAAPDFEDVRERLQQAG